jgi:hypothetical protein
MFKKMLVATLLLAGCDPNWEECTPTDTTQERHQAAWTQYVAVGKVQTPIVHPARDWTERQWHCPDERDGQYYWREEK